MQRKCNLSLYVNKNRVITRCLNCNTRLPETSPPQHYCSDDCREQSRVNQTKQKEDSSPGVKRRAEFRPRGDEWTFDVEDPTKDDALWLNRAIHWDKEALPQLAQRQLTKTNLTRKPLILTGNGVRLRVDHGSLLVHNGFTHYPQSRQEWRFFPTDPDLPSRIVLLDTNGYLTIDVLQWLSTQQTPLVSINWKGEAVTVMGAGPIDTHLRNAQLVAMFDGRGFRLAIELVRKKIQASQRTLNSLPITSTVEDAIANSQSLLVELESELKSVDDLMLIEARAASSYFQAWRGLPIFWKGTRRHAIPPQWSTVGVRPSLFGSNNRHATHPVNAMLNYAYRTLEAQVQIAITSHGLDPAIGYLHSSRNRQTALVYDLMEPLRPEVDRAILRFTTSTTFTPKDFLLTREGKCRLHPQLARRVTGLGLKDEIINRVVRRAVNVIIAKRA